jgi:hypothetical protein
MSKRYPGNFITGNPVALSQTSNNGIWDVKDVSTAVNNGTWQETDGLYEIPRSLRFKSTANNYLSRTQVTPSNARAWTFSFWIKISGQRAGYNPILIGGTAPGSDCHVDIADDQIEIYDRNGAYTAQAKMIMRDHSAWYHIVVNFDSAQSVSTERIKFFANGVRLTAMQAYTPHAQNGTTNINAGGTPQRIAYRNDGYSSDFYLTECNFIDGQALDSSYFGYFEPITNIWQPKKYTGTYGNNGFYLPFSDNSSLATLGKNFAGTNYSSNSVTPSGTYQATTNTTSTTGAYGETVTVTQAIANNGILTGNPITTVWNNGTFAPAAGTLYTQSALVKPLVFPVNFQLYDNGTGAGGGQNVTFTDANTFSTTGGNIDGVIKLTNGWYRIWSTLTYPTSGHYKQIYTGAHPTGNGSTPCYQIYGYQVNLGIGPDPIIHTSGTAVVNDFTPNNFSLTAGITYDSMVDSPTNIPTTATDVGGVVVGNYATANPYDNRTALNTFANGNLKLVGSTDNRHTRSTIGVTTGKWYWEIHCLAAAPNFHHGVMAGQPLVSNGADFLGSYSNEWAYWPNTAGVNTGYWRTNGPGPVFGDLPRAAQNDVLMFALDVNAGKIWLGLNGTWFKSGAPASGTGALSTNLPTDGTPIFPAFMQYDTSGIEINFGQRAFVYTPPTGFKSINTTNIHSLGTATIGTAGLAPQRWMDSVQYAGQTTDLKVTNSGKFQPDLVWIKTLNAATSHEIYDSVRGVGLRLESNNFNAEWNGGTGALTSFNTDGFTVPLTSNYGNNGGGYQYVAHMWKQSPTAGFNIINYTGNASNAARAISHNLGVTPAFIITKPREANITGTDYWNVWHSTFNAGEWQSLNTTTQKQQSANYWGNTLPNSSNFYVGGSASNVHNENGKNYIAYVWAEVPGFIKTGKYTGNFDANGPFINTGFKPKFLLLKTTGTTGGSWVMIDSARNPTFNNMYDGTTRTLIAEGTGAQQTYDDYVRFHSNGFKVTNTVGGSWTNQAGENYIYVAFAESPFALNNRAR